MYKDKMKTFSDIIQNLQSFWKNQGCSILQPFDSNVGAGTLSPFTALNVLKYGEKYNVCYVQYCRRPADGRFAKNSNRTSGYYQMQVILNPIPTEIQKICINSMEVIGLDVKNGEIKFIEDNWKNPSIGASGIGYEMWFNGMEVLQFTYMQKLGGVDLKKPVCELTYGLERLAMYIQGCNSIFDIKWDKNMLYSDIHSIQSEEEMCYYYQIYDKDNEMNYDSFQKYLDNANNLVAEKKLMPAFELCLKASHSLNVLDARNLLSQNIRQEMILKIRSLVKDIVLLINT